MRITLLLLLSLPPKDWPYPAWLFLHRIGLRFSTAMTIPVSAPLATGWNEPNSALLPRKLTKP